MNIPRDKIPILILGLLIVVSLSLAGGVFVLLQKEHAKNLALQDELEEAKTRQRITESKLEESKKQVVSLESKLQEAQQQIDKLNTDLEQEKAMKQEALAQAEQIRIDLEQQKGIRADLEIKLTRAQEDAKNMQRQLDRLQSEKAGLEIRIKDLGAQAERQQQAQAKQGVELGTIVVGTESGSPAKAKKTGKAVTEKKSGKKKVEKEKPEAEKQEQKTAAPQAITPAGSLEGKVLVVNKDYDFVVINLGSKDNVSAGEVFSIYHKDNYLGDITIEKVHDSMSAAGFVSAGIKDQVKEGDRVTPKS